MDGRYVDYFKRLTSLMGGEPQHFKGFYITKDRRVQAQIKAFYDKRGRFVKNTDFTVGISPEFVNLPPTEKLSVLRHEAIHIKRPQHDLFFRAYAQKYKAQL
jgi:predicted metal-dependent hydrolase